MTDAFPPRSFRQRGSVRMPALRARGKRTRNIATTVNLQAAGSATFTATGDRVRCLRPPAQHRDGRRTRRVTDLDLANNSSTSSDPTPPPTCKSAKQVQRRRPPGRTSPNDHGDERGPSDAASVSVADPTPTGLTFVSNAGDCTTAFPCSLGTIRPACRERSRRPSLCPPATRRPTRS